MDPLRVERPSSHRVYEAIFSQRTVGTNGKSGTGPGVYAQTCTTAPGLFAICGLAALVDALFRTDLDAAAASWDAKFPDSAAIFVGAAAVTGSLSVGPSPVSNPPAGSVTAETVSVKGQLYPLPSTCCHPATAKCGLRP
jgi:hypothetical protein